MIDASVPARKKARGREAAAVAAEAHSQSLGLARVKDVRLGSGLPETLIDVDALLLKSPVPYSLLSLSH